MKLGARYEAVAYQLTKFLKHLYVTKIADREQGIGFLLFVWFLVCSIEGWHNDKPYTFSALFEIVSCFGNVGLSLGSYQEDSVGGEAFSKDLSTLSLLLLVLVMLLGRIRGFPSKIDAVLTITRPINVKTVMTDDWLKRVGDEDSETEDEGVGGEGGVGVYSKPWVKVARGDGGGELMQPLLRDFRGVVNKPRESQQQIRTSNVKFAK